MHLNFKYIVILMLVILISTGCQSSSEPLLDTAEVLETDDTQPSEDEPYYFENLDLTTLGGQPASLYDYKGQLIILNFWATWCQYCEEEMPLLEAVDAREDITILAINVGEDSETVQAYIDQYGYSFNVFLDDSDVLSNEFGITGLPTSIFIGPDFEYYYTYPGLLDESNLELLLDSIATYQSENE